MSPPKKKAVRRTQEKRRHDAINAIMDAAQELIYERGFGNVSLNDVSERSGHSRGLLIHYFGSRDGLFDHLMTQIFRRGRSNYLRRLRLDASDTGLEKLLKMADAYIQRFISDDSEREPSLLILWGAALPRANRFPAVLDADETSRTWMRELVVEGQADGSISESVDPEGVSPLLVGMLRGTSCQLVMSPEKIDGARVKASLQHSIRAILTS